MDLSKMKQTELYAELKRLAPASAVGRSRSRRSELESLLRPYVTSTEVSSVAVVIPTKAQVSARKAALTKKRKAKVEALGASYGAIKKLVQPNSSSIKLTEDQRSAMLQGLDMVDTAGMLLMRSGLTMMQLANLVHLDTGVAVETTMSVLVSLTKLKTTFLKPTREAA